MTYDDAFMDGYYAAMEDMDDDYSYEGYYDEYDPAYEEYMDGYYAAMEDAAARAAANGNKAAHDYYVKSVEKIFNSTGRKRDRYAATLQDPRSVDLKLKLHDYFTKDSTKLKHAGLNKKEKMIKYRHEKLGENIPYAKRRSYLNKERDFVDKHIPSKNFANMGFDNSRSIKGYFDTGRHNSERLRF